MNISFDYNRKQVIQALRYHFFSKREIRILLIAINVFTILAAVLFYFKRVTPATFLVFSILWMFVLLVIWNLLPNSIYKKSETFRDSFQLSTDGNGMVLETGRGTQHWDWERFSKYLETPFFFHLYFTANSFFLVPKDAFRDKEQEQVFREALKSHIGAVNRA
ncbi:MAG: YcxB family protein [Flavihumibacter sp.]